MRVTRFNLDLHWLETHFVCQKCIFFFFFFFFFFHFNIGAYVLNRVNMICKMVSPVLL